MELSEQNITAQPRGSRTRQRMTTITQSSPRRPRGVPAVL